MKYGERRVRSAFILHPCLPAGKLHPPALNDVYAPLGEQATTRGGSAMSDIRKIAVNTVGGHEPLDAASSGQVRLAGPKKGSKDRLLHRLG